MDEGAIFFHPITVPEWSFGGGRDDGDIPFASTGGIGDSEADGLATEIDEELCGVVAAVQFLLIDRDDSIVNFEIHAGCSEG